MGLLDDILGKLVEIVFKPKAGQMGILNIKTEKKGKILGSPIKRHLSIEKDTP